MIYVVFFLNKQRVFIFFFFHRFHWFQHDNALEATEIYGQFLMRKLYFFYYSLYLLNGYLLTHAC
jgi:hypothetical protein